MTEREPIFGQRIRSVKAQRAKELRQGMTRAEDVLWQRLRRNQLDGLHFRRQQIIDGFIVDFYPHAAGVVIEVDGSIHAGQQDYDAERDQVLKAHKLRVLHFANDDVLHSLSYVLKTIAVACKSETE